MTHIITADEGKWITEVGFYPEQETAPSFWHEVRTSSPEQYEEVTDTTRTEMEDQWHDAHPEPEVSPDETGETLDGKGKPEGGEG